MIFFGNNLKFIRKAKGLTQGNLAESIGVKANTISNYENGSSSPDIVMLEKIVEILDIDAQSLLYENLQTKTTEKAVKKYDGTNDGENDGKLKLQKRPSNESVFAGIPDEDIFEYLTEATEKKLLDMVEQRKLIPISLYERMLKEKDEQILQEREKIWNLEQQMQEQEKRAK